MRILLIGLHMHGLTVTGKVVLDERCLHCVKNKAFAKSVGGRVVVVPTVDGISRLGLKIRRLLWGRGREQERRRRRRRRGRGWQLEEDGRQPLQRQPLQL
jgi:hypothetical protein